MTGISALANALAGNKARYDLVGPTVDDDIRRAISRYGAEAVKDAVKRQAKPKLGRKPVPDLPELREVIIEDAMDWLAGGDPFSTRSNYSIAKGFADKNPGHSHPATMKRIERKLIKNRRWLTLALANSGSEVGHHHAAHIRTLEALHLHFTSNYWDTTLGQARLSIADYETKFGELPKAEMSMRDIEETVSNAFMPKNALQQLMALNDQSGSLLAPYRAEKEK